MIFHRYEAASPSGQPLKTPIVSEVLSPPFAPSPSPPFDPASVAQALSPSAATAPIARLASSRLFIRSSFRLPCCGGSDWWVRAGGRLGQDEVVTDTVSAGVSPVESSPTGRSVVGVLRRGRAKEPRRPEPS